MGEKLITKSFERILEKGKNRGFITYEELGKSLGKRGGSFENTEKAFLIIADHKITLVEKKSEYQSNKKKETSNNTEEKTSEKTHGSLHADGSKLVFHSSYPPEKKTNILG